MPRPARLDGFMLPSAPCGPMRAALLVLATLLAGCTSLPALPAGQQAPTPPAVTGTLRVHYVDVGQGDGTIWELSDGTVVVYDCGPAAGSPSDNPMVRKLRALGHASGSRLRALVASHGHLDHVGGCEEVLSEYAVDDLYDLGYPREDRPQSYQRFLDQLAAEGGRVHAFPETQAGFALFDAGGAKAALLWPTSMPSSWDAIAEASLVVRVSFGATSFCFQGDVETGQEAKLDGACSVYLVGHHGSRYASSAAWLARMKPSVAVVSFGENSFGHPTSEALCRVQQAGATVYATHRAGDVTVESDGADVRVVSGVLETKDYCAAGADYWAN